MGIIFKNNKKYSWSQKRALYPTPFKISDNQVRIFYTSQDNEDRGRISFFDINNELEIINTFDRPVIDIGDKNTFDQDGVGVMSIITIDEKLYLYYSGFQRFEKIRYKIFTGVAYSLNNGESFTKINKISIGTNTNKSNIQGGAVIIKIKNTYRLFYVEGHEFINLLNNNVPSYDIKYIDSLDGINFQGQSKILVDHNDFNDEIGYGRPYVIFNKDKQIYQMFYSIRKKSLNGKYCSGYAESTDCEKWKRKDSLAIKESFAGFDSENIQFLSVFEINNKQYALYNGNDYGIDGIGLAQIIYD